MLTRLLQRLLILGLGIFSVWLIVFVVFEWTADCHGFWLWVSLMESERTSSSRALFAWA
jgi:hypothetical protein